MPLPAIYKRDGKECYFDTYRKKLIEITPEETVRQKIAKLFEIKYGVPEEMISLEVPMSYYAAGVSGRADIVIHAYDTKTQCCYPVTVIECKNETVLLTDMVLLLFPARTAAKISFTIVACSGLMTIFSPFQS